MKHDIKALFSRKTCAAIAALLLGAGLTSAPARAGFEWTPPPARPAGPVVQAVPVQGVDIVEMIDWNDAEKTAPAPVIEAQPVAAAPRDDAGDYAVAEGFGREIPLALVMQQVVPPGYAYAFDPGIDPGTRVSWDGGKPWNVVLKEAVAPLDVDAFVVGKTVWLRPAEAPVPLPAAAPAMPEDAAQEAIAIAEMPAVSRMMHIESMDYERLEKGPAAGRAGLVTDRDRLVAIGADDGGYAPSYPRRIPVPVAVNHGDSTATGAPQAISPAGVASPFAEALPLKPDETAKTFSWQAEKGASLKDTLTAWTETAGVRLFWDTPADYALPGAVKSNGAFADVLGETLAAFEGAADRPLGRLYPAQADSPAVLLVQSSAAATVN